MKTSTDKPAEIQVCKVLQNIYTETAFEWDFSSSIMYGRVYWQDTGFAHCHDYVTVVAISWVRLKFGRAACRSGNSLEEFLVEATSDVKLRQVMMSLSEAIRTIAFKVS